MNLKATYRDGWKDLKFLRRATIAIMDYITPDCYMKNKTFILFTPILISSFLLLTVKPNSKQHVTLCLKVIHGFFPLTSEKNSKPLSKTLKVLITYDLISYFKLPIYVLTNQHYLIIFISLSIHKLSYFHLSVHIVNFCFECLTKKCHFLTNRLLPIEQVLWVPSTLFQLHLISYLFSNHFNTKEEFVCISDFTTRPFSQKDRIVSHTSLKTHVLVAIR